MSRISTSIEIDGEKLQKLLTMHGMTPSGIDRALDFSNDYTRRCIQRDHIDEVRYLAILSHCGEHREDQDIETEFDLSDVPTWQLLAEIKRRDQK